VSEIKINTAGWIAQKFVSSKLTILFILACLLIGTMAILQTPREENPQIIVPGAEVFVSLPGATASEVEQLVVNPLEAMVRAIPGVDHTYATAMNSMAILSVQFEVGLDKEESLVKLYDKILGNQHLLPKDASRPLIKSVDVDDVPIVVVTLASEEYSDYALKRLGDHMVERLRSLDEVAVSYVKGGLDREVRIELDPERLLAFGITLDQVQMMLKAGNLSAPIGSQTHAGKNIDLYMDGFLTSAEDVKRVIVGNYNKQAIYLEDVADIIDGPGQERDKLSRFAFGSADARFGTTKSPEMSAVSIAVAKKTGTNAVFVAEDVLERIQAMQENFLPKSVHVVVTRNDGDKADAAVNNLLKHLILAVSAVFIIVVIFLGLKEALIVGITVPLILALTLGVDYFFGFTINRVTLLALILSLGMLVDSSIVVIENIHRHYFQFKAGSNKAEITVLATNEIGNPTNLATFAIILVFGSLSIMSGMSGQFFFPIAFNVPVVMFASLVVAYIVTPWATNRWLQLYEGHSLDEHKKEDRLHTMYYAVISPMLDNRRYRYIFTAVMIVLISLSLLQPMWQFIRSSGTASPLSSGGVGLILMPKDDVNTFNITIDMPEFTPVEVTDKVTREIGRVLQGNEFIINYQSWIGQAGVIDFNGLLRGSANKKGPHVAEIRVNLIDKVKRGTTSIDIVKQLRPALTPIQDKYPGTVILLVEDPAGPPLRATLVAEVYGKDPEKLREISKTVTAAFKATYGVIEVRDSEVEDIERFSIVVDKEKAALSGITTAEIAVVLRRLVDGEDMGRLHIVDEKKTVPIRLHIPRRYQINPALLSSIFVMNKFGERVPLSELTRVEKTIQDRPISHKDYERVTFISAEFSNSSPINAVLDLEKRLDNLDIGDGLVLKTANLRLQPVVPNTIEGYQLLWDGEIRQTLDVFRDLMGAFAISLIIIYLLLIGYYSSFIIPLVAMSAIPLSLIGVFPGHWITGEIFTATSMIGIIALAGVVVRNSLLIIDFIQDNLKLGNSLHDAVREAGAVRLRPILLTALAIVSGSAVMLSDPIFVGLATSLIFGTIVSTVLTLVVVPTLYYSMATRLEKKEKLNDA